MIIPDGDEQEPCDHESYSPLLDTEESGSIWPALIPGSESQP